MFTEVEGDDFRALILSGLIPQEDVIKMYEAIQCPSWGRLARYLSAKSDRSGRKEGERKEDSYANGLIDVGNAVVALRNEIIKISEETLKR